MATQLAPVTEHNVPALSADAEKFELLQRQARMFASSPLVPDHLRRGSPAEALANCYIALTLAQAMGEVPLVVMQNIHIVNGKAGFATQYMIARANAAGIFRGRIDWRIDRSDDKNLSVTAFAVLKDTGQEVSVTCDMAMATAEGWTKNPKYRSMPEVMLRYRSAAFLVRFYAPDVMLGYQSTEEIEDVGIASGPDLNATPLSASMLIEQAATPAPAEQVDEQTGEVIDAGQPEPEEAAPPEWRAKMDGLIQKLSAATTAKDIYKVEKDWNSLVLPAVDDEDAKGEFAQALAAAKKRYQDARAADEQQQTAEKTAKAIDGPQDADAEPQPEYLAQVRAIRASLDDAQTTDDVDAIDREWTNRLRVTVEDKDAGLATSIDRAIISRKRELRAQQEG